MIKARTFDQVSAERMKAEPTPETDAAEERRPTWIPDVVQVSSVPVGFARNLERERNRYKSDVEVITKERDKARNALRLIADDCEAWLAGESDEPSMEFITIVAKYARGASK